MSTASVVRLTSAAVIGVLGLFIVACSDDTGGDGRPAASGRDAQSHQRTEATPEGTESDADRPYLDRGCGWHLTVGSDPGQSEIAMVALAMEGDLDGVAQLLASGESPNQVDSYFASTPLFVAVDAHCVPIVEALIDAGADPNQIAQVRQPTPLAAAVMGGDPELVEVLLEAGADPSAPGWDQPSVLHTAVSARQYWLLELMIPNASDLDVGITQDPQVPGERRHPTSAIETAAEVACAECIRMLLDAGATPTAGALHRAVETDDSEIVHLLLAAGAPAGEKEGADRKLLVNYAQDVGAESVVRLLESWEGS